MHCGNPVQWCQEWDAMATTRSATKMEEQLQLLIAKMDEQTEQLQLLTKQQSQKWMRWLKSR